MDYYYAVSIQILDPENAFGEDYGGHLGVKPLLMQNLVLLLFQCGS
jgi:hypothetical protein